MACTTILVGKATHEMIYDSLIKKDIETLNAAIDEHYDIIEELLG